MQVFYNMVTLGDDPSGVKEMQNPTKNLQAFFFSRSHLKEFLGIRESGKAGVYILYGNADGDNIPKVYIGQSGTSVASRLSQHDLNKEFWTDALAFVQKPGLFDLNAVHAKIIESLLISRAADCGSYSMMNATGSNAFSVQPWDEQAAESWAEEIVTVTKMLGLQIFVKEKASRVQSPLEAPMVTSKGKRKQGMPKPVSYCVGLDKAKAFESWKEILVDQCEAICASHGVDAFLDVVNSSAVAGRTAKNLIASRKEEDIRNRKTRLSCGIWLCTNYDASKLCDLYKKLATSFPDQSVQLIYPPE